MVECPTCHLDVSSIAQHKRMVCSASVQVRYPGLTTPTVIARDLQTGKFQCIRCYKVSKDCDKFRVCIFPFTRPKPSSLTLTQIHANACQVRVHPSRLARSNSSFSPQPSSAPAAPLPPVSTRQAFRFIDLTHAPRQPTLLRRTPKKSARLANPQTGIARPPSLHPTHVRKLLLYM